jgi:hypothetical protein
MAISVIRHLQRRVTHHLLKPFREVTRLDHAGCEKVASGVQPILRAAKGVDDTENTLEPTERFGGIYSIRSNLLDGKPRRFCRRQHLVLVAAE